MSSLSAVSVAVAGHHLIPKNPGLGYVAHPRLGKAINDHSGDPKKQIVVTYRDGIELTYLFDASVQIADLMQLVSRAGTVRKVIL